ncbi:MAG: hypothetical protein GX437_07000 [Sphingobacteriales bacterium]|nr:hypothetical protein [Sphingobacteriales bacterium]
MRNVFKLLVFAFIFLLVNCHPDDLIEQMPEINVFESNSWKEYQAREWAVGTPILLSIEVKSKNILKYFQVKLKNNLEYQLVDTSFSEGLTSFVFDLIFYKSDNESDTLIIYARDSLDKFAEKSVILKKANPDINPLTEFTNVRLSARFHEDGKSFLSMNGNQFSVLNLEEAYNKQADVQFFYYFYRNKYLLGSLASKVEADVFSGATPVYRPENWMIRNKVIFKKINLSDNEFQHLKTDSLLLYQADFYNPKEIIDLQENKYWMFSTSDFRLGILKVLSLHGNDSGYVDLDIKIQNEK